MRRIFLILLIISVVVVLAILGLVVLSSSPTTYTNSVSSNVTDTLAPFYLTRGVEQTAHAKTATAREATIANELKKDLTLQVNQPLNEIAGIPAVDSNLIKADENAPSDMNALFEDYALAHLPTTTDLSKTVTFENIDVNSSTDNINLFLEAQKLKQKYPLEHTVEVVISGTFSLNQAAKNTKSEHILSDYFSFDTGNLLIAEVTNYSNIELLGEENPIKVTPSSVITPHLTPNPNIAANKQPTFTVEDVKNYLLGPIISDEYGKGIVLPHDKTKVEKIELMTMQQYIAENESADVPANFVDPADRLIYVAELYTDYTQPTLANQHPQIEHHVYFLIDAHDGEVINVIIKP